MEKVRNKRYVLTGGPGAGKTTVLNALTARKFSSVQDVARETIKNRLRSGLPPRPEPVEFAYNIFTTDVANYQSSPSNKICFFDRGIVDSLGMLKACSSIQDDDISHYLGSYPYNKLVFLFPPWQSIFHADNERDQTWSESVQVYEWVKTWYRRCNYQIEEVPIGSIEERVAFIEKSIT